MLDDDLRQRRLEIIREHMDTEVTQEFDRTLATFNGHPRYEIMPTGQVFDGDDEVMGYYRTTRTAFPDQRHDNVRHHVTDDAVIVEFDLLGTNLGDFYGLPPTGKAFRVPIIAVFFFDGDRIVNERVYFDSASLVTQIGRGELLAMVGDAVKVHHLNCGTMHPPRGPDCVCHVLLRRDRQRPGPRRRRIRDRRLRRPEGTGGPGPVHHPAGLRVHRDRGTPARPARLPPRGRSPHRPHPSRHRPRRRHSRLPARAHPRHLCRSGRRVRSPTRAERSGTAASSGPQRPRHRRAQPQAENPGAGSPRRRSSTRSRQASCSSRCPATPAVTPASPSTRATGGCCIAATPSTTTARWTAPMYRVPCGPWKPRLRSIGRRCGTTTLVSRSSTASAEEDTVHRLRSRLGDVRARQGDGRAAAQRAADLALTRRPTSPETHNDSGTSTTLPTFSRAARIRCASAALANGTASWTTGTATPSASAVVSGPIHGSRRPAVVPEREHVQPDDGL